MGKRAETLRIISARRASRRERKNHEEGNQQDSRSRDAGELRLRRRRARQIRAPFRAGHECGAAGAGRGEGIPQRGSGE